MSAIYEVFRRELAGYFATPLAYVFIVIFLCLAATLTFTAGNFFGRNQADLTSFFVFHPAIYLLLIPAIAMRLWAEERKTGTIELFLTLPIMVGQAVIAKFLAAWVFAAIALVLTFPIWLTVNYLGAPDNGVIAASYFGSWLMAGGYLAISSAASALTKNQVIAFILAAAACFLLTVAGLSIVTGTLADIFTAHTVETIAWFSFFTHFQTITSGVINAPDLIFFVSIMIGFLAINAAVIELNKAD